MVTPWHHSGKVHPNESWELEQASPWSRTTAPQQPPPSPLRTREATRLRGHEPRHHNSGHRLAHGADSLPRISAARDRGTTAACCPGRAVARPADAFAVLICGTTTVRGGRSGAAAGRGISAITHRGTTTGCRLWTSPSVVLCISTVGSHGTTKAPSTRMFVWGFGNDQYRSDLRWTRPRRGWCATLDTHERDRD